MKCTLMGYYTTMQAGGYWTVTIFVYVDMCFFRSNIVHYENYNTMTFYFLLSSS